MGAFSCKLNRDLISVADEIPTQVVFVFGVIPRSCVVKFVVVPVAIVVSS